MSPHDRLDACSDWEKHLALCWVIGYNPDAFGKAMDHIEDRRTPPRIPEPGQFGVVEAAAKRSPGRHKWVRQGDLWWNGSAWNVWGALIDPVLVREGVSA